MNQMVPIVPATSLSGFTAEEFVRMVERGAFEDMRVELDEGRLVKMMPGSLAHGELTNTVFLRLQPHYRQSGYRIGTDVMVQIGDNTVRGPDQAVFAASAPLTGAVPAALLVLAIEVAATTLNRDLGEKAAQYAAAGIPTYWVVDLDAQVTHVLTDPAAEGYRQREVVRFAEPLTVPTTQATITLN